MTTFGERIRELMVEKSINTIELGKSVGVTSSKVSRWYLRNSDVTLNTLIKICEYFNCSLEFLSGRIEIDTDCTYFQAPNFYERLSTIMKERGITEYRITKEKVFSRNMYFQWKNGSQPRLSSLIAIADYLDCTLDYLVGRE